MQESQPIFLPLAGKTIILGVSGSIAAYKAAEVCRLLLKSGATVRTCLSENAENFIGPETFRGLTSTTPYSKMYGSDISLGAEPHITLANGADLMLICPATASMIAKLCHGIADDPVSLTALSHSGSLMIAPAMAAEMWQHPKTKQNFQNLSDQGCIFIGPEHGVLASGAVGEGRMTEPAAINGAVCQFFGQNSGFLAGKVVTISAGGTRERIDPIRYISNFSSGKMGHALAEAARDLGAEVHLVSSSGLPSPYGVNCLNVESAEDMKQALSKLETKTDILVMAAAVADYRPTSVAKQKLKKSTDNLDSIDLIQNEDIVANLSVPIKVAFAAETENLIENATKKLITKKADLIVANDVSNSVFDSNQNQVCMVSKDGQTEQLSRMSKYDVAYEILSRAIALLSP